MHLVDLSSEKVANTEIAVQKENRRVELFTAIEFSDSSTLNQLLDKISFEHPSDYLTLVDAKNRTTLIFATQLGKINMVSTLLQYAQILTLERRIEWLNQKELETGKTAEDIAINFGFWGIVELISTAYSTADSELNNDWVRLSPIPPRNPLSRRGRMYHLPEFDIPEHGVPGIVLEEEEDAMVCAAAEGDLNEIHRLLDLNFDLRLTDLNEQTALMAAVKGHSKLHDTSCDDIVNLLIAEAKKRLGIDGCKTWLNEQDSMGWTALMFAAYYGEEVTVGVLLSHGADPDIKNGDGNTYKELMKQRDEHLAFRLNPSSLPEIVFSDENPIGQVILSEEEERDMTLEKEAMVCAAAEGDLNEIHRLLDLNFDLRLTDLNEQTALMAAVKGHSKLHDTSCDDIVNLLIAEAKKRLGIDGCKTWLNEQDSMGWTALMFAAYYGEEVTVGVLLSHGADPDIKNGDGNTYKELIQQRDRHLPFSPSFISSSGMPIDDEYAQQEAIRQVILSKEEERKMTFTQAVTFNDHPLVLQKLKNVSSEERQALVEKQDVHGRTPLLIAAELGYEEIAKTLLDNNANSNFQKGRLGMTPAIAAVWSRNVSILSMLVDSGANLTIKGPQGLTALDIAKDIKDPMINKYLKDNLGIDLEREGE